MRTIKQELFKLFSKRNLLILTVILLAINIASLLFVDASFGEINYRIPDSAFRKMQADLKEIPDEERADFVEEKLYALDVYSNLKIAEQISGDFEIVLPILEEERAAPYIKEYTDGKALHTYTEGGAEELFLEYILQEMQGVYGYNDYLDDIQQQAEKMNSSAIFRNPNTFARRNIAATAKIYSKMPKQELPFTITFAIEDATDNFVTEICGLLAAAFAALTLICDEKESGAFTLIRTLKKGRCYLILCKIAALFIFCLVAAILFTGSCIITDGFRFGFVDLSVPIQSVSGFLGCTLQCSLGVYLILYFITKTFAYFIVAMLIFTISIFARNNVIIYAVSGGIIAAQTAMYLSIDSLSVFSTLKYWNIIALTQTNQIIGGYQNINFFGFPVNLMISSVILAFLLCTIFISVSLKAFSGQKNTVYSSYKLSMLLSKINPFGKKISVSLFRHECHKIFVGNKGIFVLLIMLATAYVTYSEFYIVSDENDVYYGRYAAEHGGTVTSETDEFMQSETERFALLEQKIAENGSNVAIEIAMRSQGGFEIFCERYNYAKENPEVIIIYDTGYINLFSVKITARQLLVLFIFMSVMFAPVYASDSRTMPLIYSTKHGRKRDLLVRFIICGIITAIMFSMAHTPIFLRISQKYGLDGLNSSVRSISTMRNFPFSISILEFLILRYSLLMLLSIAVMVFMMCVSRKIKSPNACMILLLALFALPCAIVYAM